MKLFDPKAYHLHHKRAKKTFHAHNFLFEHVGNELVSRLNDLKKSFNNPLNLSPHPLPYSSLHHPLLEDYLLYSEDSFDLILSCLQAHWVNNLPGHLKRPSMPPERRSLFGCPMGRANAIRAARKSSSGRTYAHLRRIPTYGSPIASQRCSDSFREQRFFYACR